MGKPGIPPYGREFTLVQLPWDEYLARQGWQPRRYVSKIYSAVHIRPRHQGEEWYVMIEGGTPDSAFPAGDGVPFDTLREAMPAATALAVRLALLNIP
jgi:hypothetical protein